MYKNAVHYKGVWLAPGSQAFELYHSKDPKARQKLDQHMKEVDARDKALTQGKHNGTTAASATSS